MSNRTNREAETFSSATLPQIREMANEISHLCYHFGHSPKLAGEIIETELDGTQPSDLISNAIALVEARN